MPQIDTDQYNKLADAKRALDTVVGAFAKLREAIAANPSKQAWALDLSEFDQVAAEHDGQVVEPVDPATAEGVKAASLEPRDDAGQFAAVAGTEAAATANEAPADIDTPADPAPAEEAPGQHTAPDATDGSGS